MPASTCWRGRARRSRSSPAPAAVASGPAALVRFRDVEKTYDGRVNVVDRLNLEIGKGEFLTLLGPSGSGKTTILLMLAGFEAVTAGDIALNDRSLRNVPPFRRNMGIVFQNYALFPHRSVFQNVAFPLVQRRLPKPAIRARVEAALRMVDLSGLGDRRPHQLSGGQQQRVALARALVFEPEIVLMDEPLGALDKKLREQMQIEIKHLHEQLGMTVAYVTHDQGEALTMSDRVAVMHGGRIQQVGPPQEVYEEPANAFVANFIGENNSFEGRIESVDGRDCAVGLASGGSVRARSAAPRAAGEAVTLSLRPERVVIGAAAGALANRFRARVVEVIYFGAHNRVRLALAGRDDIIALAPAGGDALAPGAAVEAGWAAEHCRVLAPA